jgi:LuxR family transcriptional regulator, maltose regulon positive regulatory protein
MWPARNPFESVETAAPSNANQEVFFGRRSIPPQCGESEQAHLQVRFFGPFEVLCEDRTIPLGRNTKALAILKYMLANRTKLVSRDYLMEWLWPEASPKRARSSLNTAIYDLRSMLSSYPLPEGCSNHIVLDERHYRLCSDLQVWTDVDEFEACYAEGSFLERTKRLPAAVAKYEEAVGLYRGDFLSQDLYEEWTIVERERLCNAYMDMLRRLAERYMDAGQYAEGIHACFKLLDKDVRHEAGHYLLMCCYAGLGLCSQALLHYCSYEQILQREFSAEPATKFQDLRQKILCDGSIEGQWLTPPEVHFPENLN